MKNSPYFRHDAGARNDPKIVRLVRKKGAISKAIYWDLIEMLFEEGGKLPMDAINDVMFTNHLRNDSIVNYVVLESGKFENDGINFWCPWVLDELKQLDYWASIYSKTAFDEWSLEERNSLRCLPYKKFLKTRYWQDVSREVKERSGDVCSICGKEDSLEVHHISYNHHGNEFDNLDDLICLCHECHSKQHGL